MPLDDLSCTILIRDRFRSIYILVDLARPFFSFIIILDCHQRVEYDLICFLCRKYSHKAGQCPRSTTPAQQNIAYMLWKITPLDMS